MDIFIKRFTRLEEAKQFWDASAYDIIDIGLALSDKGLKAQSLEFSLHFGEPDLMKIYSNFKIDFQYIKDLLGIPEIYIDRNVKIEAGMAEPARNANSLQYTPQQMQARFSKLMEKFNTEVGNAIKKLAKEEKQLVEAGVLKKEDVQKPMEINSKYEEEFKKLADKK